MDAESLLAGLNEPQRTAVTSTDGPLVVLAGAGSGKTRVLTRRIAYRIASDQTDPRRVLALTFTRKAAGELRDRLRSLGLRDDVVAGTFHGIALTQLRQRWNERGIEPPQILDRKVSFVARLMSSSRGVDPLDVVSELEWARARLVDGSTYAEAAKAAGRTPPIEPAAMGDLMERFAQEKRRRRLVDFDDLLALAIRDIRADPDYAAAVRWRHRHLYVDEFQDVNPLQFELLSAWRGNTPDLFVVGDPNQAIYGWNGADPGLLARFASREPGATVIDLRDNYRSSPQILTLARAALGTSKGLEPHRGDGPVPDIRSFPDDAAEAAGIVDAIRHAHSVTRQWRHQAVLVRTNAQLAVLEQALSGAGIPAKVKGGAGPLGTPEVKTELRALTQPGRDLQIMLAQLDEAIEGDEGEQLTQAEIERRSNLGALSRLVHEYLSVDPEPTGPGLNAWIGTLKGGEVSADGDAVELATFHGAKGLEWPIVHIAGVEQGLVPIGYAKTGGQLEEEKRLLYVAITRAEQELHLTWAAERTFGNKTVRRQPSPYLGDLQSAIDHLRAGRRPMDWKAQVDQGRKALRRPKAIEAEMDDPIFIALRAWRRSRAKAADVPAYVIFNDSTLRAVAAAKPKNRAQLGRLPGIGPVKLERYAEELLDVISEAS